MRDILPRASRPRRRFRLNYVLIILAFFLAFASILSFFAASRHSYGNSDVLFVDRALDLTPAVRSILMLNESARFQVPYRLDNPWRSSRRGCGGHVRPSIRRHSLVSFRYAIWSFAGVLVDSSSAAQIRVGSGQDSVFFTRRHRLYGLCSGDIVLLSPRYDYNYKMVLVIMDVSNDYVHVHGNTHAHPDYAKADALALVTRPVRATRRRLSCLSACRRRGLVCSEKAFIVVNDCDVLRRSFNCSAGCEVAPVGAAGADMPCYVSPAAPRPFRKSLCLVAPNPQSSRCAALHQHTVRLCPCVAVPR